MKRNRWTEGLRILIALICVVGGIATFYSPQETGLMGALYLLTGLFVFCIGRFKKVLSVIWMLVRSLGRMANKRADTVAMETRCHVDLGERHCLCPADYFMTTSIRDYSKLPRDPEKSYPICGKHHIDPDMDIDACPEETHAWLKRINARCKYIGPITRYRIK